MSIVTRIATLGLAMATFAGAIAPGMVNAVDNRLARDESQAVHRWVVQCNDCHAVTNFISGSH